MADRWLLRGGRVVADGRAEARDLGLADGRVAEASASGARVFDATGLLLAPGIVDLHGDGFERVLMPRLGVQVDLATALLETDAQLIANGITTAYLAVTLSWEPGLRAPETAAGLRRALAALRPALRAEIRLQYRWEIFALDAATELAGWLSERPEPVLALNDHLTPLLGGRLRRKLPELARRAGISEAEYDALVARTAERAAEVPAACAGLVAAAAAAGIPVFAHDEPTPEARRANRARGIAVSEFPLTAETAREAVLAGEATVLGAPNVLRGGSHIGALGAAEAVAAGLCTALASDYYYPAPLRAAAQLGLVERWGLVSEGPARAVGLTDRGRLAPGLRADVLALRETAVGPVVEAVWVGGRVGFLRDPGRLG